jgi:hypothetical protein
MPIKPENKHRYPKDWKQIRARILERAKNRCERCNVRQYGIGYWVEDGFQYAGGNIFYDDFQYTESYSLAREACDHLNEWRDDEPKSIVIVLTIAHLDHTPENCADDNLQALCQRCHLRYDAEHHAKNAAQTRAAKRDAQRLLISTQVVAA